MHVLRKDAMMSHLCVSFTFLLVVCQYYYDITILSNYVSFQLITVIAICYVEVMLTLARKISHFVLKF